MRHAVVSLALLTGCLQPEVRLRADRAFVSGQVVDARTGEPLRDALVIGLSPQADGDAAASTDANGRFAMVVPPGRVLLLVERQDRRPLRVPLQVDAAGLHGLSLRAEALPGDEPIEIAVELLPPR